MSTLAALSLAMVVNIGSHHWINEDQNEQNPGFGIESERWAAGYYLNSTERHSVYAGRLFQRDIGRVTIGVLVGGVTGYDHLPWAADFGPVTPAAVPFVMIGGTRIAQVGDATALQWVKRF